MVRTFLIYLIHDEKKFKKFIANGFFYGGGRSM